MVELVNGRWWEPGQSRRGRFGTLTLDHGAGYSLRLQGALDRSRTPLSEYPVIVGRAPNGDEYTLLDCFTSRRQSPWRRAHHTGTEETIVANVVLKGAHVPRAMDPVWSTVVCRFPGVSSWAARLGQVSTSSEQLVDGGVRVVLTSTVAAPFQAATAKGVIVIARQASETATEERVALEHETVFSFRSDELLSLESVIDDVIRPLQYYLVFATGVAIPSPSTDLYGPKTDRFGPLEVPRSIQLIRCSTNDLNEVSGWESLLPLGDERFDQQQVLVNWFNKFQIYANALDVLFAATAGTTVNLETRFLLLVQSAEILHRRSHGGGVLERAEHRQRLQQVVEGAPPEHREWLRLRLAHSNEPTLEHRLVQLQDEASDGVSHLLRPDFAKVVAATRNYLTHYDSRRKKLVVSEPSELYWLGEEVRVLVSAFLLQQLSVEDPHAWSLLSQTRMARALARRR